MLLLESLQKQCIHPAEGLAGLPLRAGTPGSLLWIGVPAAHGK